MQRKTERVPIYSKPHGAILRTICHATGLPLPAVRLQHQDVIYAVLRQVGGAGEAGDAGAHHDHTLGRHHAENCFLFANTYETFTATHTEGDTLGQQLRVCTILLASSCGQLSTPEKYKRGGDGNT